MMNDQSFNELLHRYLTEELSAEEARQLFLLLEQPAFRQRLETQVLLDLEQDSYRVAEDPLQKERIRERLRLLRQERASVGQQKPSLFRMAIGWKPAAAAAVLLLAAAITWLWLFNGADQQAIVPAAVRDIPAPAGSRAAIRLADGRILYTDSAATGTLAVQGGMQLVKLPDGELSYRLLPGGSKDATAFNTLINPAGSRVISLALADGSKVWLNASSSITYPVAFNGPARKVQITGEAYFEAAPDPGHPFVVAKDALAVTVIGTRFNINAYEDEDAINVTLLQGSVRVSDGGQQATLQPGQQATVAGDITVRNGVNTEQVMAWKDGLFNFHRMKLEAAMRQLSRWYDVEVVYEKNIPDIEFGGKMGRNLSLTQVLEGLREMGVRYRIEDNRRLVILQ